jgi:hypothetical protein
VANTCPQLAASSGSKPGNGNGNGGGNGPR